MLSTLAFALLSVLAREDLSGYDIAQRMRRPIGFFWQARHSQIYPELAKLEAAGLIRHRLIEQADRPDRKLHTITASGLAALKEWVVEPPAESPVRDELVLKTYSLWLMDPGAAITLFREEERRQAEVVERFEALEQQMIAAHGPALELSEGPEFAVYATLQRGLAYRRSTLDWCRWMLERLRRSGPSAPSSAESPAGK
jgi:DNA-binding PadR family transcriptional regulator